MLCSKQGSNSNLTSVSVLDNPSFVGYSSLREKNGLDWLIGQHTKQRDVDLAKRNLLPRTHAKGSVW